MGLQVTSAPLKSLFQKRKTEKEPCTLRTQVGFGEGGVRGRKRCADEGGPGPRRQRAGPRHGRRAQSRAAGELSRPVPLLSSCSARPRQLKSPPPPTFSKNHTREGKNIAGLSNEIIPTSPAHAQSFLTGGWALLPAPPSRVRWKREQGVQHRPRLRAHSCPRPLTSPRNVLLPFTKHLYSPPA